MADESMEVGKWASSQEVGKWASSQEVGKCASSLEVVRITSTMDELRTKIQSDLVRGVTLDVCLSRFGQHFARPDPGMFKVDHSLYDLSKQMNRFHSFLSHDWSTSRWLKVTSLLILYNSRAAFVSSLLVSICVSILRATDLIPDDFWPTLLAYSVFPLVLLFWQRIRSVILRSPRTVFFDKLCIAQHDEELKRAGIFGLAAFLDHSDNLTVLWSKTYFSRLWCTYEISTFLRETEKPKPIVVMPVKLAVVLMIFSAAMHVVMVGFSTLNYFLCKNPGWELRIGWIRVQEDYFENLFHLPLFGVVTPLLYYIGLGMMADLAALPDQLRHFRVQDADCFCCSNQHRHPETGEVMPCDRLLMFRMLKRWYGRENDPKGEKLYLERFNYLVQEELAPKLLRSMGSDTLPLNYSFYMLIPAILPVITTIIPKIMAGHSELPEASKQVVWALRLLMNWSMDGILALFWMRSSMRIWLMAVRYMPQCCSKHRLLMAFLLTIPETVMLTLILCSCDILYLSKDDSMVPAIPFSIWLFILCCLWSRRSHVFSQAPDFQRSGSADLESLESVNGYQMEFGEYDEYLPRENSSGDLNPLTESQESLNESHGEEDVSNDYFCV